MDTVITPIMIALCIISVLFVWICRTVSPPTTKIVYSKFIGVFFLSVLIFCIAYIAAFVSVMSAESKDPLSVFAVGLFILFFMTIISIAIGFIPAMLTAILSFAIKKYLLKKWNFLHQFLWLLLTVAIGYLITSLIFIRHTDFDDLNVIGIFGAFSALLSGLTLIVFPKKTTKEPINELPKESH